MSNTTTIFDTSTVLIDTETGEELLSSNPDDVLTVKKLTPRQKKNMHYEKTHVKNFTKGKEFVIMFSDIDGLLADNLTGNEFKLVHKLENYVEWETGILIIGEGTDEHYCNLKELAEELKYEYNYFTKLVRSLTNKGIMSSYSRKNRVVYIVNPYVYLYGQNPEKEIVDWFTYKTNWFDYIQTIYGVD